MKKVAKILILLTIVSTVQYCNNIEVKATTNDDVNITNVVIKSQWQQKDGKWYYYDENGVTKKGWAQIENHWYYFDNNGVMQTGWQKIDGTFYYLKDNGEMQGAGWAQIKGSWYHFDEKGGMQTGWQKIDGTFYYLKDNGEMQGAGWAQIKGSWYHFDEKGGMQTGWQKIDGTFYYLKDNGEMQGAGWAQIKGSWYHFDAKGGMQTGWQSIDGKNYYLGQDGAMKTGLVDGRYLSSSGAECRKIRVEITGYCPCNSCGGGRTASGKEPRDGITIAAPTELGFGTKIVIPGYTGNNCYVVEDRGGAIKKVGDVYKIDIFKSNHKAALDVGRRYFDAYIVE